MYAVVTTTDIHKSLNKICQQVVSCTTRPLNYLNSLLCCKQKYIPQALMCAACWSTHAHAAYHDVNLNRALTDVMFLRLLSHYHKSTTIYWPSTLLMNQVVEHWVRMLCSTHLHTSCAPSSWRICVHTCMYVTVMRIIEFPQMQNSYVWKNVCTEQLIWYNEFIDLLD